MKLALISGSLRATSRNMALLRHVAELAPDGVDAELLSIRDLPLFDADLLGPAGELPAEAARLRGKIAAADAVLIATPEYNYGLPGPLKNAIDWTSRPAYRSVWAGKPVATLTLSPSPVGGARAHAHLKQVLLGMAASVLPAPELALGGEMATLDEAGRPTHPKAVARVERWLIDSVAWAKTLSEEEQA